MSIDASRLRGLHVSLLTHTRAKLMNMIGRFTARIRAGIIRPLGECTPRFYISFSKGNSILRLRGKQFGRRINTVIYMNTLLYRRDMWSERGKNSLNKTSETNCELLDLRLNLLSRPLDFISYVKMIACPIYISSRSGRLKLFFQITVNNFFSAPCCVMFSWREEKTACIKHESESKGFIMTKFNRMTPILCVPKYCEM